MYDKIKQEMEIWFQNYENIFEIQEKLLLSMLDDLKDTVIGKERNYAAIKNIEQFQNQTPIQHYSDIKPYVDRIVAGEINVLYPTAPIHWIQTSGSTGYPKLFPYNEKFAENWYSSIPTKNFIYRVGLPALKILEGESFLMHASGNCGTIGTGITAKPVGFVTGWLAKQTPPGKAFAPPLSIQSIADWDERIFQTAVYYVQKDLRQLIGVTTYLLMFLRQIENAFDGKLFTAVAAENPERAAELERFYHEDGKLKISKVWTNLLALSFGGVDPYKYKNWIESNLPNSIIFQNYAGSEGLYGFQYELNNPAMVFIPENSFYEFLDVDEYFDWKSNNGKVPTRYTVEDIKENHEYVFCVSNYLGFTTYIPGDIITIISKKPLLFLYSRRLSYGVNIAAEKMSDYHIKQAIKQAENNNSAVCREYLCTAIREPLPHYVIAIDFAISPNNLTQFATSLEQSICQLNVSYADVRQTKVLKPLRVIKLPAGEFERYIFVKTQSGEWNPGQKKLPYLTDNQNYLDFFQIEDEGISKGL